MSGMGIIASELEFVIVDNTTIDTDTGFLCNANENNNMYLDG